jgi:hypothetical protein
MNWIIKDPFFPTKRDEGFYTEANDQEEAIKG